VASRRGGSRARGDEHPGAGDEDEDEDERDGATDLRQRHHGATSRGDLGPSGERAHERLRRRDGIVLPVYARIDWASLIRRVYWDDVLACPCGGRRRVVADIGQRAQREAIVAILTHLGIPTEPPPIARARG
jgi:hypothetical protein